MHADTYFAQQLLKRLAELRVQKLAALAGGQWAASAVDMGRIGGEALRQIGYLKALEDVVRLCEDVEADMNKRD